MKRKVACAVEVNGHLVVEYEPEKGAPPMGNTFIPYDKRPSWAVFKGGHKVASGECPACNDTGAQLSAGVDWVKEKVK